jgi:hypothetical protein
MAVGRSFVGIVRKKMNNEYDVDAVYLEKCPILM